MDTTVRHDGAASQNDAATAFPCPSTATFVDDQWLSLHIGMKVATIRSQRFKRRHGLDHWLDLDPVMIGTKPRYRLSEALAWLEAQGAKKAA